MLQFDGRRRTVYEFFAVGKTDGAFLMRTVKGGGAPETLSYLLTETGILTSENHSLLFLPPDSGATH